MDSKSMLFAFPLNEKELASLNKAMSLKAEGFIIENDVLVKYTGSANDMVIPE